MYNALAILLVFIGRFMAKGVQETPLFPADGVELLVSESPQPPDDVLILIASFVTDCCPLLSSLDVTVTTMGIQSAESADHAVAYVNGHRQNVLVIENQVYTCTMLYHCSAPVVSLFTCSVSHAKIGGSSMSWLTVTSASTSDANKWQLERWYCQL